MKSCNFSWILFVSRRFANIDRNGRSAITSHLASLGICFGVMTLIIIISVMNGFQLSFIDAIMEVSSYHVRVSSVADEKNKFQEFCEQNDSVKTFFPFLEAQSLMVSSTGKESAALIRALPENIFSIDSGLVSQLKNVRGQINLESTDEKDSIILGSSLASSLGVKIGSTVNLLALSGGTDVELISNNRIFTVRGIFHTGYAEINSSYAFISYDSGKKYFGESSKEMYGIKLKDSSLSQRFIENLKKTFPGIECESWKNYNRSFFGALRVEKNMLMLFVFLIFVVVCINIFNGMRRIVYERRNEISVLSALGGKNLQIQMIFILRGLLTGIYGAIPGLVLGLFVSIHISWIFRFLSVINYWISYFFVMLTSPENIVYVHENPMFLVYSSLPARILVNEVLLITFFGIFSSLAASFFASRGILKLKVAEVLRDE